MTDDFEIYYFWIFIASTYMPQKGISGTFLVLAVQPNRVCTSGHLVALSATRMLNVVMEQHVLDTNAVKQLS